MDYDGLRSELLPVVSKMCPRRATEWKSDGGCVAAGEARGEGTNKDRDAAGQADEADRWRDRGWPERRDRAAPW